MHFKHWHKNERPREKLLHYGADHLSDAELLAVLLGHGFSGTNVLELAHQIISQCGSLANLFHLGLKDLKMIRGLGHAKFCQIKAALELSRRQLKEALQPLPSIHSSHQVELLLLANLRHQRNEVFACLFLNNHHQIIEFELLKQGGVRSVQFQARDVIERALHYNATALILAHNHPSGEAKPSQSDIEATHQLMQTLAVLEIRLLDHCIVAGNQVHSMAEYGEI